MKILIMANTFGYLPKTKVKYDLLIHCGNWSNISLQSDPKTIQIMDQSEWIESKLNSWLESLNISEKIFIAGSHDYVAEYYGRDFQYKINSSYLQDEVITINKTFIYGSPWSIKNINNKVYECFSLNENAYKNNIESIPSEIDMLITRQSPFGYFDNLNGENKGSVDLLSKIDSLKKLKLFVCCGLKSDTEKVIRSKSLTYVNANIDDSDAFEVTI